MVNSSIRHTVERRLTSEVSTSTLKKICEEEEKIKVVFETCYLNFATSLYIL